MFSFTLILATFALAGSKLLYNEQATVAKVKIALVTEDSNPLVDLAIHYVGNMDSVESIREFHILDEAEAYKRLKKGESIIRDVGGKSVIYMGPQHRGGGDDEGQIFVNQMHYSDLQNFKVEEANILAKIKEYGNID